MSQRVTDLTKWVWCLLALHSGSVWTNAAGVQNKNPPSNPTTVEAQAKFFQDFFSVQLSPYKIEFGHVCEDPNNWEQRYEKKDYKNHRDMGKVRWGDKKGGYGEHYWDLNHAGHNNDNDDGNYDHDLDRNSHDHDDGSYNEPTNDAYDEPSEQTLTYENDSYDPEKASQYNENERSKRAHHLRSKSERKTPRDTQDEVYRRDTERKNPQTTDELVYRRDTESKAPQTQDELAYRRDIERKAPQTQDELVYRRDTERKTPQTLDEAYRQDIREGKQQKPRIYKIEETEDTNEQDTEDRDEPTTTRRPALKKKKVHKIEEENDDAQQPADIKKITLEDVQEPYYQPQRAQEKQFVPYDGGAGVRQHYQAASAPRLFLEPSTGHVVDRATGQAYMLQPIIPINNNY